MEHKANEGALQSAILFEDQMQHMQDMLAQLMVSNEPEQRDQNAGGDFTLREVSTPKGVPSALFYESKK